MQVDLSWITPEIKTAQAHHHARVASLYEGVLPEDEVVAIAGRDYGYSHGLWGTNDIDMLTNPEAWLADVLADMAANAVDFTDRETFKPMVIEIDPLGTHYIDALFGAGTRLHGGQVWSQGLDCHPGDLQMPDLNSCEVFQQSLNLTRYVVEATQGQILITTPVLSCPMNIGMNLFGQRFVEVFATEPRAAHHALQVITDVILTCINTFAEIIPEAVRRNSVTCNRYAPPGFGFIDGCATHLISAGHYQEFIASLDAELLAASPHGGMIHLCGDHARHIPIWREMPMVSSIQLNDRATEDFEAYLSGLRPDQVLYISPTDTVTSDDIIKASRGARVILQAPLQI